MPELRERMAALSDLCDGLPGRFVAEANALRAEAGSAWTSATAGRVDVLRAEFRDLAPEDQVARVEEARQRGPEWLRENLMGTSFLECERAGRALAETLAAWRHAVCEGRSEDAQLALTVALAARAALTCAGKLAELRGDTMDEPVVGAPDEPRDSGSAAKPQPRTRNREAKEGALVAAALQSPDLLGQPAAAWAIASGLPESTTRAILRAQPRTDAWGKLWTAHWSEAADTPAGRAKCTKRKNGKRVSPAP